ncbi:pyridoxal phosphate-dependent aminotransferase [Tundrisphaera lichenicola]|uniref:pyridoxal phosphate-dependent aminotransferase n=1 Tax=Tundrisphaera lichenicola TaxID=2029860 RepID=UPI003EBEAE82
MNQPLGPEQRRDLARRGYSRRDFGRIVALLTAGGTLPFYNEAALAQGLSALPSLPADAVRINANENPMGPCPEAIEAIQAVVSQGGRYLYGETGTFVETIAGIEGLSPDSVLPFAGSSDPLHRAVLAFTSPTRSLVTADPGYEAAERAARFVGANVIRVPLRKDGSHDIPAMIAADPEAGLLYVCNPNNPTGTVTKKEDVDALVAGKPKGAVILLDEAYIHLSTTAEPGTPHVLADRDVVILRTFSKLYGMAGLRAGAAFGRPDLLEKIRGFGAGALPVTGMVGATASLKAKGLVESRRKIIGEIRGETVEWLDKKGYAVMPSEANMIMIDVRRPGRSVFEAMIRQKVAIGRTWASMPNHVRVSIGTRDEMAKFRAAFARVMDA